MPTLILPSSPSAQITVLSIPELFTLILLHIPRQDLLLLQRTCHTWNSAINSSPALQAYLFFLPSPTGSTNRPFFNPLLVRLFPAFFSPTYHHDSWSGERSTFSRPRVSPSNMTAYAWFTDPVMRARVLRPEASWRRMFPVQPAVGIGTAFFRMYCGCGFSETEQGVFNADVVRERVREGGVADMGLWWDVVIYVAEEWPWVRFFIDWGDELQGALQRLPSVEGVSGIPEVERGSDGEWIGEVLDERREDGDDFRDVVEDEDGGLRVIQVYKIACMVGGTRVANLLIAHSGRCFSKRGDVVPESALKIGDGGFGGVSEVLTMSGRVHHSPEDAGWD